MPKKEATSILNKNNYMNNMVDDIQNIKTYFESGSTKNIAYRIEQLRKLKAAILKYEDALNDALHKDLRKSKEEIWLTETGLVIAEINYFIKRIKKLSSPQKVPTNLINQPGKSYIVPEPLGVVLIIAPWNYPLQLLLMPLVGAIAAGNCVVLKPSEFATATTAVVQQMVRETFNSNYIQVVNGDGSDVIPKMMSVFRFDHIFFTGSTTVGREIYKMAAENLVPVTLELGGKSPCIITQHADLKLAAKRIALAKFSNAGQMCIAPDYLLVHASVKQIFIDVLKETIVDFYTNNPQQSYDFGRIINQKQFDRLIGYFDDSTIIFGGEHDREKLYMAPTIIDEPNLNHPIMQEEIFGPLLPVLTYTFDVGAVAIINKNINPLAFYIFTNNKSEANDWLQKIPSGGACVNAVAVHCLNKNLPFGGRGASGTGRYHGKYSFETFSHQKSVLKAATWPDFSFAYPSFKGKINLLKRIMK